MYKEYMNVHDEHHAFGALIHAERNTMTNTFPSNKWTISLWTKHTDKDTHEYILPAVSASKLPQF